MEHSSANNHNNYSSRQVQSDRMARLIQEQAQLLKQFEEAARADRASPLFVKVDVSALMDDPEVIREQQRLYSSFQSSEKASPKPAVALDSKKKCIDQGKARKYQEDTTHHLENGQTIRMTGMKHVYQSIGRGSAVLVQCPNCETVLQVDKNASMAIYCVMCQQISHADVMSPSRIAAGKDGLLAKALQLQEAEATLLKAKHY